MQQTKSRMAALLDCLHPLHSTFTWSGCGPHPHPSVMFASPSDVHATRCPPALLSAAAASLAFPAAGAAAAAARAAPPNLICVCSAEHHPTSLACPILVFQASRHATYWPGRSRPQHGLRRLLPAPLRASHKQRERRRRATAAAGGMRAAASPAAAAPPAACCLRRRSVHLEQQPQRQQPQRDRAAVAPLPATCECTRRPLHAIMPALQAATHHTESPPAPLHCRACWLQG